jgi:hypothetical protein
LDDLIVVAATLLQTIIDTRRRVFKDDAKAKFLFHTAKHINSAEGAEYDSQGQARSKAKRVTNQRKKH